MSGVGQRLRLRLFLEGVEVPVISASVSVVPNAPAECSIQIPPMPDGMELLPRTLVHLFFLDPYEVGLPFPTQTGGVNTDTNQSAATHDGTQGDSTPEQGPTQQGTVGDDPDARNEQYKLLFGGEVIGFQWTKNQASRSLVLQCQDWSNYWDYAYQWQNTDLFGPGVKALFSGGSTNLFTDFLEDEGSAILRIVQTPSVQYPKLKGLLGGIVHLLEAIGGSYYYGKQFAGQNIFFSIAELRLHITQMITAYEGDPTASRLIGAGYDSLLGRTLGGLGQQVSIRQAINALMGIIFHETYAQPCPRFRPGGGNSPSGKTRQSVRRDPANAFIALTADVLLESLQGVRDTINIVLDTESGSSDAARASLLSALASMRGTCRDAANHIRDKQVLPAKSFYASAQRSLDQAQAAARKWRPSPNTSILNSLFTYLDSAEQQLKRAAEFEVTTTTDGVTPARLHQQIFRPDVWFSAPPRCNVIFPEHYHTLTYSRQFLAEPTRLLLKTNDEFFGEDELFDKFYFAPKGFTLKSGRRELQNMLANDLLDHELFTGILPVFEKMGELNIFGARSGKVKGKAPKIGLAQRSTNFLYFKYRFAARQMQVQGRFNPYLAPGFPALVVDRYVNSDTLALRQQLIEQNGGVASADINKLLGTHFLCNLTQMEHSVSQQSGGTSLNCSYARSPSEGVEFLGVIRPDQTVQKRSDVDASRQTVVAAIEPPLVRSLGPTLGAITAVEEVTQAYKAQDVESANTLELYQGPLRHGTMEARVRVAIGLALPASAYGDDVVTLIGNPNSIVTFRAFRITEDVPRYKRETVDLPAEEYIRPGWYGDIWHPAMIGQAYQDFFATGSITDEAEAGMIGGGSVGLPAEDAAAALQKVGTALDADDPSAWAAGLLALAKDTSIEGAVAFILQTYSYIKLHGLSVDDFIRSYTWRPIASMPDMFGSSDLTLDAEGHAVVQGVEGFHSRAFGGFNDLFGLVTPDIESITGIKRGSTVAQKGDVRGRKQLAVQEYVSALQFARAILG